MLNRTLPREGAFHTNSVHAIDSESCEEGEWRVNARETISALQNSNGRLFGEQVSGRGGSEFQLLSIHPTPNIVQMVATEPIETLVFEPQCLIIPRSNRLNLRVHRMNSGNELTEPEIESGFLIGRTSTPAPPVASGSGTAKNMPTELEVNWLKNTIRKRPDYATFDKTSIVFNTGDSLLPWISSSTSPAIPLRYHHPRFQRLQFTRPSRCKQLHWPRRFRWSE
ncbi:hypothetical protein DFH07DRAFT_935400 [Mycena maculata]|uniref:Uncharacterized protein n=1 Tax=Mycena maculata TaxID=230809 RepID=A0AAD7P1J2_9AGAR|nr:hypothetical protein DFH07DRAFT_935400 [Mycena maculata]